jgi:hypothetical protein
MENEVMKAIEIMQIISFSILFFIIISILFEFSG